VLLGAEPATLVERVTVNEHFIAVEYVAVHQPERRAHPREPVIAA